MRGSSATRPTFWSVSAAPYGRRGQPIAEWKANASAMTTYQHWATREPINANIVPSMPCAVSKNAERKWDNDEQSVPLRRYRAQLPKQQPSVARGSIRTSSSSRLVTMTVLRSARPFIFAILYWTTRLPPAIHQPPRILAAPMELMS
jgi:hypothetical protein